MELIIERTVDETSFDEVIELAIKASLAEEDMDEAVEISVAVLNKEYMGRDGATDVLSFPQLAFDEDKCIFEDSMTYNGDNLLLGDIVISLERAREQAAEYGHSERREVGFLTVHSMLHLLGYDHMEDADREEMQTKEKKILAAMNLPRE